jgi:hypothetical protein
MGEGIHLMQGGSSDLVREIALENYIQPAISSGRRQFSIAVKDLMKDLRPRGFPASNYSQICSSIREKGFVKGNGLKIIGLDGPPSGQSSTVVVHYERIGIGLPGSQTSPASSAISGEPESVENPAARAQRMAEKLRGLLKAELQEYGGGEAFLRWIRAEDETAR